MDSVPSAFTTGPLNSTTQWINHYLLDNLISLGQTCPMDGDLIIY